MLKAHRSAQERQTLREAKATREAEVVQKRFQVQSGDGGKDQRTQSCLRAGFVPRSRRGRDVEVGIGWGILAHNLRQITRTQASCQAA